MRTGCLTVSTSFSIEQRMSKPNLRNRTNHNNKVNTEKHPTKAVENADTDHPFEKRRMHRRKHQSPISRSRVGAENDLVYPQDCGYYRRSMRNERLAENVHLAPAITCHLSAQDTPVRLSPMNSLQEMAKRAATDRSKGSDLSIPRGQKTNVPLAVLSSAGEVGRE
jgi:hypothetical protein